MKRKVSTCLMIVLFLPLMARAQDTIVPEYKNVVKINTAALIFQNISLLYERKLNSHWTLLTGAGYRWGGMVPNVFGLGDILINTESNGIRGFSITPEIRYYFNFCECGGSPSGLYAGFYGRYTKYYGDLTFSVWNGSEYYDALVTSNLREFGAGLQLGYQFIFKKRFTVDFMFAGPRLSTYKLRADIGSDDLEALVSAIEERINERREAIGMDPITIEPSSELEANFGFKHFRYAVGFGFMF